AGPFEMNPCGGPLPSRGRTAGGVDIPGPSGRRNITNRRGSVTANEEINIGAGLRRAISVRSGHEWVKVLHIWVGAGNARREKRKSRGLRRQPWPPDVHGWVVAERRYGVLTRPEPCGRWPGPFAATDGSARAADAVRGRG